MKKLVYRIIRALFLVAFLILALDYSGKVAKEKRYESYATEAVDVDTIAARREYTKSILSLTEPFRISFQKQWIPEDEEHVIDIQQEIRKIGDTVVTLEKAYLSRGDVTLALSLEHHTVVRSGAFLYDYMIDKDGAQHGITPVLKFYSRNEPLAVDSFGYGYGSGSSSVSVSIPLEILEQYNYSTDVEYDGFVLYGYEYTGD